MLVHVVAGRSNASSPAELICWRRIASPVLSYRVARPLPRAYQGDGMKNGAPFAALTFAFTIAGLALGYSLQDRAESLWMVGGIVALIGGAAAFLCRQDPP